jgi:glucose-1-phosphate cytidylyltransferase
MCTYTDGLANVDLPHMLRNHLDSNNLATVAVGKEKSQYGVIELLGSTNQVSDFKEKPVTNNWINIGFFIFSKEVFSLLDPNQQLEPDLLPKLIQAGMLAAHRHEGSYYTVDTRKDLANLETDIQKGSLDWI